MWCWQTSFQIAISNHGKEKRCRSWKPGYVGCISILGWYLYYLCNGQNLEMDFLFSIGEYSINISTYIYISIDYELVVTSGNWLRQIFNMPQKQNCKCSNLCIHCIMHKNFYYPQGKDQIYPTFIPKVSTLPLNHNFIVINKQYNALKWNSRYLNIKITLFFKRKICIVDNIEFGWYPFKFQFYCIKSFWIHFLKTQCMLS